MPVRARLREHLNQIRISMNNAELIDGLNHLVNREVSTFLRYILRAASIKGADQDAVRTLYQSDPADEIGHAQCRVRLKLRHAPRHHDLAGQVRRQLLRITSDSMTTATQRRMGDHRAARRFRLLSTFRRGSVCSSKDVMTPLLPETSLDYGDGAPTSCAGKFRFLAETAVDRRSDLIVQIVSPGLTQVLRRVPNG